MDLVMHDDSWGKDGVRLGHTSIRDNVVILMGASSIYMHKSEARELVRVLSEKLAEKEAGDD